MDEKLTLEGYGVFSLGLGFITVLYPFLTGLGSPIFIAEVAFGFFYVAYRMLYKHEDLSKSEWVAYIILIGFFMLFVNIGFGI